jgi:hypothetical protein
VLRPSRPDEAGVLRRFRFEESRMTGANTSGFCHMKVYLYHACNTQRLCVFY